MKTMKFLLAYARIYGMMNCFVTEVLEVINNDENLACWLHSGVNTYGDFIDAFLRKYDEINSYGLIEEVCQTVADDVFNGYQPSIWEAAAEWDV